jgi:hypothetical protein
MAIKLEVFEVSNLKFEEVKLSSNKSLRLPRYNGGNVPDIKLPSVVITQNGVPRISKYFPTDKDRMFLQLPLEGDLLQRFRALDHHLSTNEFKQRLFKSEDYSYSPLVKNGVKGEYIKLKLQTDFETGDIETMVWKSRKNEDGSTSRDGNPFVCSTLDEFSNVVRVGSTVLCIIKFVKIWMINKQYGLTVKLMKVNTLPGEKPVADDTDVDF